MSDAATLAGGAVAPAAFSEITIRDATFANRIWVSPMCQYSAVEGMPQDWHLVHLGALAVGGPGLVMAEATGVSPEARITPGCAGIWTDEQGEAWARIVAFAATQGVPLGLQLSHAGRKASTASMADGSGPVDVADGGWETVGPSAQAYTGFPVPRALTVKEIDGVVSDFAAAARRAVDAGFAVVEIHAAHGYLLHQFLSPLSNERDDEYGGSFENRARLLLRTVDAVRAAIPAGMPLFVRLSGTDWVEGGWAIEDVQRLAPLLVQHGVDLLDISSGGLDARQVVPRGPGYQVPFARAVRDVVDIPVAAVGQLRSAEQFEETLLNGDADVVFAAREFLRNRMLPRDVAIALGVDTVWPDQYLLARSSPRADVKEAALTAAS